MPLNTGIQATFSTLNCLAECGTWSCSDSRYVDFTTGLDKQPDSAMYVFTAAWTVDVFEAQYDLVNTSG